MTFSQIKPEIQNLGKFKSLKQIKKAGLRIVYNKKADAYWLIEKEFLKPVIKSPRECKSILIKPEDLKYKVFMCRKSRDELKGSKVLEYIEWGERQNYHKVSTVMNRKFWWKLEPVMARIFIQMSFNDIIKFLYSDKELLADARLYTINPEARNSVEIAALLNTTITLLEVELYGRANLGEGALDFKVYEAKDLLIYNLSPLLASRMDQGKAPVPINESLNWQISKVFIDMSERSSGSIFTELGFNPLKPIRQQEPNPLPDRKAIDDIVFDALGLSPQERKEVYWAVAELVQNRLKKARSV